MRFKSLIYLCSLILLVSVVKPEAQASSARGTVEKYCLAEYQNNSDMRRSILAFTPEGTNAEKMLHPDISAGYIIVEDDPFFIVNNYRILEVHIRDNVANAVVEYEIIAKAMGGGKFISYHQHPDISVLTLILVDDEWKILDPPKPRISLQGVIETYPATMRSETKQLEDRAKVWPNTSPAFSSTKRNMEALLFLKQLAVQYGVSLSNQLKE